MALNQVVSGSLLSWNTVPAVSESCFLHRLHRKTSRGCLERTEAPAAAGRAGQPLPPTHREQGLPAGLLGPEPLPKPRLAQAADRGPRTADRGPRAVTRPPMPCRPLASPGIGGNPTSDRDGRPG